MPKCCWEEQKGRSIIEIAMDVRTSISGASDWYEGLGVDIKILHKAIANWEPSFIQWTERVDNSVRNLIESVLLEINRDNGVWLSGIDNMGIV
ncbi:hypothetical protein E4G67_02725 [Candidatus Bathyarchaeota archaeon]|nr:MAG: hypothetical protein E4G67_02725 [Candidatus Bathyarchaeota archaeon]